MASTNPQLNLSWVYHFTDSRNLVKIKELGGLYSTAKLKEFGVFGPGHYPGGNEWSVSADERFGMDHYVHLCLRNKHPMEHIARGDGRIAKTSWLYVDSKVMRLEGVLMTMDVSNKSGIQPISLEDAGPLIDYEVLKKYLPWSDPAINARLNAMEKVEVLVPDFVPLKYFERYFPNG